MTTAKIRLEGPENRLNQTASRAEAWAVSALLLFALGLRLYHLGQASLWVDEIGQVWLAHGTWAQTIFGPAEHVAALPLDYIITRLALTVGSGEAILRLPAVICGVATVWVLYRLGRDLFGQASGFLAAFLLTIMPLHVYYSREVRFYSLTTLLILMNLSTFCRALTDNRPVAWAKYGVTLLLALYAHYYACVVVGVEALWLLGAVLVGCYGREVLRRFAVTSAVAGALFVPWLYYTLALSRHDWVGGWTQAGPGGLRFGIPSLGQFLASPLSASPMAAGATLWWAYLAMIAGGAISAVLSRRLTGRDRALPGLTLLSSVALVGIASVVLLDALWGYFFNDRQLVIYAPLVLLILAASVLSVCRAISWRRWGTPKPAAEWTLLAVVTVLGLLAMWGSLPKIYSKANEDWRGAGRLLLQYARPHDVVLAPEVLVPALQWYAPELAGQIGNLVDVPGIQREAAEHDQVWVLHCANEVVVPRVDVDQWLDEERLFRTVVDRSIALDVYSHRISAAEQLRQELLQRGVEVQ